LVDSLEEIPEPLDRQRAAALLADKDLVVVVRGDVSACQEVLAALLDEQIPAVIVSPPDVEPRSGVAMMLEVRVAEQDLEPAVYLLQEEWEELLAQDGLHFPSLDDKTAPQEASTATDGPPACPACGSTKPLVEGACPECGLFLGETEDVVDEDEPEG
jgi:hypothetical protein